MATTALLAEFTEDTQTFEPDCLGKVYIYHPAFEDQTPYVRRLSLCYKIGVMQNVDHLNDLHNDDQMQVTRRATVCMVFEALYERGTDQH